MSSFMLPASDRPGDDRRHVEWVLVAVALGAWARVSGVELGWFMVDQVRDAFIALNIANGTSFPLVGPQSAQSSVSITGPVYYYLLAIPYALWADPLAANWFSVLLSIAAVFLVYRLGAEMFTHQVGVIAALLYATHPFAVINGLAVWNPGLLPLFCIAFVLTLWRYCVRREPWRLAVTLILLAFVLNVHLTSGPLLLLLPLAWLIFRPPVRPWPLVVGLTGALLFWAPYAVHELRSDFAGVKGVFRWAGSEAHPDFLPMAWKALVGPFLLPSAMRLPSATGERLQALGWFGTIQGVAAALFLAGVVFCCVRLATSRDRGPYAMLLAWLVVPFPPIAIASTGVLWYYFDVLYPLHCLVIAVLTSQLIDLARASGLRQARVIAVGAVAALVAVIVSAQAWYLRDFFTEIRTTGVIRTTADLRFDLPQPTPIVQETMALASKRALAAAFASRLGADHATLESRAHGDSYWQFREDRGMLLALGPPAAAPAAPGAASHYTVLRDDFALQPVRPPTLRVGPYGIWASQPLVQHDAWKVSTRADHGWSDVEHDVRAWRDVSLPARMRPDRSTYGLIPYSAWGGHPVAFRGVMLASGNAASLWIVVSLREKSPHDVVTLFVNGTGIWPARSIARRTVETNTQEILFDVSAAVRPGANTIAFMVEGTDREFDLDVYEVEADPAAPTIDR